MENNLKLLTTVSCDTDADIILSKLGSENIIGIKKYSESAAAAKLYCGTSSIGVDIYVWVGAYERAAELISECDFTDAELTELAEGSQPPADSSQAQKGFLFKFFLYSVAIAAIILLLYLITR